MDDDFNTSSQIDVAVNLIQDLCNTYPIDTDRLYTTGQTGLMAVFDADSVPYTDEEWRAQEDRDIQNTSIKSMIAEGLDANFITFTKGTTVAGGTSGSEHLTSFDYAYKLEAVRDWLFAQSK